MVIIQPDMADDLREPLFERMKEIISQKEGELLEFDDWGTRQMAYEIKKKKRGHYVRLDYCGMGAAVAELERFFRIDDRIMKYMTILLSENADPETIRAELAAGKTGTPSAVEDDDTDDESDSDDSSEDYDGDDDEMSDEEDK